MPTSIASFFSYIYIYIYIYIYPLGFQIESSESKSYITNQEGRDDESFTRKKEDSPQCNLNFIRFLETEQRCHRENCTCQIDTCIT
jgi:hypothetical protein